MKRRVLLLMGLAGSLPLATQGQTSFTWQPTAGGTYDWQNTANWSPTGFPSGAGHTATLSNNITGSQTINLNADRTVGTLNLGDSNGDQTFTLVSGTGANSLIFDSGLSGVPAALNITGDNGAGTNNINANVTLNSDLVANLGNVLPNNTNRINFGGNLIMGSRSITFEGGQVGSGNNGIGLNNVISTASAVITNNSTFVMRAGNMTNFLGTLVLNGRASGSNAGTLYTSATGTVANAQEIIINGALSNGVTQLGGLMQIGDGNSLSFNPGQRLTQNTVTMNGGTLIANGQPLDAAVTNRLVKNDVNLFNLNSGYSLLSMASSTANGGSQAELNVTQLQRNQGATLFVRGSNFGSGNATNATFFRFGNNSTYLLGIGGTGTQRSIIPWMTVANTNTSALSADTFATYDGEGVRGLVASEYNSSLTAGPSHNVSVSSLGLTADATVNSLRFTLGSASNIGAGRTLTVASGGVIFATGGGAIGASGNASAGTLNFGSAEGVVWVNGSNTNTIGAVLAGSGGLTKAGTGTLILTGSNSYTGATHVSGGTLRVGDGTNSSNLGAGDVVVAAGALLDLRNSGALSASNTLRFTLSGLLQGSAFLAAGTNNTVSALYFGDQLQAFGTWGATGSGATYINDTFFSGTGILTVIPEPSAAALLVLGAILLAGVRRRRM